jgi:hypothetical protein
MVACERVGQDLECDVAIEFGVPGSIDLPHAAFAEQGGDVVGAQTETRGEGQWWVGLYREAAEAESVLSDAAVTSESCERSHDSSNGEPLLCDVCVTGSVTVGSRRDEQDAAGHNQAMRAYLA